MSYFLFINLKIKMSLDLNNIDSDIYDEIDELLELTYSNLLKKYPELNLGNINKQIEENKNKVNILLWWQYKDISTENNRLLLSKINNNIELKEIVSHWLGDIYLFLLIKYSIDNNKTISWKAEPFLHKQMVSQRKYNIREKKLRAFYDWFLFKSINKSIVNRNKLIFDFDNFTDEELNIFYKRLSVFNESWKWPR